MKTEALIAALAADSKPGPGIGRRLVGLWLPGFVLAALVLWLWRGAARDPLAMLGQAMVAPKLLLPLALAPASLLLCLRGARPELRPRLALLLLAPAAGLALWLYTFEATPAPLRGALWRGSDAATCLFSIFGLSLLPLALVLVALARGASLRPARTGFAAGVFSASSIAVVYALHCTEDSPLFYLFWYGGAILGAGLIGALAGRRWLRW